MRLWLMTTMMLQLAAGTALAVSVRDGAVADAVGAAPAAYARLLSLEGRWETTTEKGTVIRLTFEPVARGSALVERYEAGPTVTQTVYPLDGARLLLTHYCAQVNQPRLVATIPATGDPLVFTFLDVTNLAGQDASHMVACEFVFEDADHFLRSETYQGAGGDDTTTRRYQRVAAAP